MFFVVLKTAALTLIPLSIMAIRAQRGAADPTDVFVPILITTYCASLIGLLVVAIRQKINLFDKVLLSWLVGGTAFICGIIALFMRLSPEMKATTSNVAGNIILFGI